MKAFLRAMLAVFVVAVCLPAAPLAAQDGGVDEQARDIAKRLNCPTCSGRNLADCPTDTCAQWKAEIAAQLRAGRSADEVTDSFINRFGPGVLQEPPRQGGFLFAWAFPGVLLMALLAGAWWMARGAVRRTPLAPAPAPPANDPFAVELERQVRED